MSAAARRPKAAARARSGRPLWQAAASFAARAHLHQVRKDGRTPYIAHPFRVTLTVAQVFGCRDEAALAAAILHDTIEDTQTDYDDIEGQFGRPVAECVAALTKNMLLPEAQRERDYYGRLRRADWRARLIKLGDAYDNFCDRIAMPDQRRKTIKRLRDAIDLVKPDAPAHEASRRGLEAARRLLGRR
ncbi:MAG: HD domain-containing protein [Phycisphaerales bacterium]